jgi:hypothetical protein
MTIMYKSWSKIIFTIAFGFFLASCNNYKNNSPIPESAFSTKIIGSWQGAVGVGELKETMTLKGDCTFVCNVRQRGFIANTLSQSLPGTIRGRWQIKGATITLEVTSEKNEQLVNNNASSRIVAFKPDSLVLKSDNGDISVFRRILNL